jgi:hypothetical protein
MRNRAAAARTAARERRGSWVDVCFAFPPMLPRLRHTGVESRRHMGVSPAASRPFENTSAASALGYGTCTADVKYRCGHGRQANVVMRDGAGGTACRRE